MISVQYSSALQVDTPHVPGATHVFVSGQYSFPPQDGLKTCIHANRQNILSHEKTNNVVYEQVRHKLSCSSTEECQKLEISDSKRRWITKALISCALHHCFCLCICFLMHWLILFLGITQPVHSSHGYFFKFEDHKNKSFFM